MTQLPGTPQTINGTRYYITPSGGQIIADQWDKLYLPAHGLKMKGRTKGENPDKRMAWVNDKKSY